MSQFLNLGTTDFLGQVILCCGTILCMSRMLNNIADPYPLDAHTFHTSDNKNYLQTFPKIL